MLRFFWPPSHFFVNEFHLRKAAGGISLAVQWLRLCISTAGGLGSIPDWGTTISLSNGQNNGIGIWWGNNGNSDRLIFLGSEITADGDCSHEIKRRLLWCLLLGRKAMNNLDSILKNRNITWLTKVCLVKAMVFPVVMYVCESWTLKKSERRRIDASELWY